MGLKKFSLMFFAFFLLLPAVSGIGSFAVNSEKSIDGTETEIRIGLFNTENSTRKVTVSGGNRKVDIEPDNRTIFLEPSETTGNPSGSGWISIGDKGYIKPRYMDFKVVLNRSYPDREREITLSIVSKANSTTEGSLSQKVLQEQSHSFKIITSSAMLAEKPPGDDKSFLWSSESRENEVNRSEEEAKDGTEKDSEENHSEAMDISPEPDRKIEEDEEGVNLFLASGAVLTVLLFLREVLR